MNENDEKRMKLWNCLYRERESEFEKKILKIFFHFLVHIILLDEEHRVRVYVSVQIEIRIVKCITISFNS